MPTVGQVLDCINEMAPFENAMDFDNAGFLVGNREQQVETILLAMDATQAVVHEAIEKQAQLLITHHPLLFHPIKSLTDDSYEQRVLRLLTRHEISLIAAHTNWDIAPGGVCESLADRMELSSQKVLCEDGYGIVGKLLKPLPLRLLAHVIHEKLRAGCVQFAGDPNRIIKKLAVACGSGGSAFEAAKLAGADAILTGETRYDMVLHYAQEGMGIVVAGHYDTEKFGMQVLSQRLQNALSDLQYNVRLCMAESDADVFTGAIV